MWEQIFGKPDFEEDDEDKKFWGDWWNKDNDWDQDWDQDWDAEDKNDSYDYDGNNDESTDDHVTYWDAILWEKQVLKEFFEPLAYLARELIIDGIGAKLSVEMTFWMKLSNKLHGYHHDLCDQMPLFESDEDKYSFKKEEPLMMAACGEKAKLLLNYAAFAGLLAAYSSHNKFRMLLWFLRVEDHEDRANEQFKTASEFQLDFSI